MSIGRQRSSPGLRAESEDGPASGAGARADELLGGLEEIFLREGFRRMTIGELATRLRCSRRSLYELAASKHDLFALVLDRLLRRIDAAGRVAAAEAASYEEKATAFIEPGIAELRGASAAFFADIAGLPAARNRLAAHQESRVRQLEKILADGVRAKAFRKVHAGVAARALVAAYRAVTDAKFLVGVDVTLTDAIRQTESLFLQGLLHPDD
ncbi:MAG: TetR/AcrR family transcriptional regulator [Deltaproteobacteria bacterium]|nr:TetR/AcrR family transcriptional regulator [Deltaproteobacteria bacterium]